ncbi:arginyl-tRna synthetase family protein [Cardiosporidium cionae]|uniref:arginine--tRNA ligase n=1 Tax=Cardiosporidium cionae TaxID=476202 RepID=A0ABQ7JG42_9APIC|nr:arginyl-tRna synthetase family protein [Cardiosporidium cionae]|eukprot:KAF8822855.1 arginyl-tRna synthetase family protein [Cardiosporidium cionae]
MAVPSRKLWCFLLLFLCCYKATVDRWIFCVAFTPCNTHSFKWLSGIKETSLATNSRGQSIRCRRGTKKSFSKSASIRNPLCDLPEMIRNATVQCYGAKYKNIDPELHECSHPRFGDFQSNVPFRLAELVGASPSDVAKRQVFWFDFFLQILTETVGKDKILAKFGQITSHPKGFINIRLCPEFVAREIQRMHFVSVDRMHPYKELESLRIVVDFSSPNLAKPLHVGHMRSILIGDSLCRTLEYVGHFVSRVSHVGDWGLPFGMLLAILHEKGITDASHILALSLDDLEAFYQDASTRYKEDALFRKAAKRELFHLQAAQPSSLSVWRAVCTLSRRDIQEIYTLLDVRDLYEKGESSYATTLPDIFLDLKSKNLLHTVEGIHCVALLDAQVLATRNSTEVYKKWLALQREDGTYLYAATDLAALHHRWKVEKADKILYVVDSTQATHLQRVFEIGRVAELIPKDMKLQHVSFGLVSAAETNKKLSTRRGDTVRLKTVLEEAIHDAELWLRARNDSLIRSDEEFKMAAKIIGIGTVKYSELSINRNTNYKFSLAKALTLSGNTAIYVLYALVRMKGIHRRIRYVENTLFEQLNDTFDYFDAPEELLLAKHIVKFPFILLSVVESKHMHKLCDYLYILCRLFNRFYEQCPVLYHDQHNQVPTRAFKNRAKLCIVSEMILEKGLNLLGMKTLDRF